MRCCGSFTFINSFPSTDKQGRQSKVPTSRFVLPHLLHETKYFAMDMLFGSVLPFCDILSHLSHGIIAWNYRMHLLWICGHKFKLPWKLESGFCPESIAGRWLSTLTVYLQLVVWSMSFFTLLCTLCSTSFPDTKLHNMISTVGDLTAKRLSCALYGLLLHI